MLILAAMSWSCKYCPRRIILVRFPRSQHRLSLITPNNPSEPLPSKQAKRWNFRKVDWEIFRDALEKVVSFRYLQETI